MLKILTFLLFVADVIEGFSFYCDYEYKDMKDYDQNIFFTDYYSCVGYADYDCGSKSFYVEGIKKEMLEGRTRFDVKYIFFHRSKYDFFPLNFGTFFPAIEAINCIGRGLKSIANSELDQFPRLKWAELAVNKINYLPSDLFKFNPELEYFSIAGNPIKAVGEGFFYYMPFLSLFYFYKTDCLDQAVGTVEEKKKAVEEFCSIPDSDDGNDLPEKCNIYLMEKDL
jgi:hypothetical protein